MEALYEALERLESYAPVISEHLALITWFSDHESCKHWQAELDAWATAMKRYNKGKMKKKGNYTEELILDVLEMTIDSDDKKDLILIQVESHGLMLKNKADWHELEAAFKAFSMKVLG